MSLSNVWNRLMHRPAGTRRHKGRRPAAYQLCLQGLEERCLLSYQITDLGTLPGYTYSSWAYGINNNAQVVGSSCTTSGACHAFLWDAATGMQDLGTLPGYTYSVAIGINNNGQVVGYSYTNGVIYHAFLWDATNGMQDLGTLPGFGTSIAYGINDSGQ